LQKPFCPPDPLIVLFLYDPSRSQEVAKKLLEGFQGYVQTDGYQAYNFLEKEEGVTLLVCMAHAQRKFADACKASGKKSKKGPAGEGLAFFKDLYRLEAKLRDQKPSPEELRIGRQKQALLRITRWRESLGHPL